MNIPLTLKITGITVVVIIVLFLISLFELWTQLARYKNYWDRGNTAVATNGEIVYVALGDSTAQGIGATHPSKGYVGLISSQLSDKYDRSVRTVNLSKSGARIHDVLDTQLPELQKRGFDDTTVITMEIGANDIVGFNANDFEAKMDELMGKLPKQTVMTDIPYFGDTRFKNKNVDVITANQIMYKLAEKHGITLVPLYEKTKQNGGLTTLAQDLFHPSNKSYRENWAPLFMERL